MTISLREDQRPESAYRAYRDGVAGSSRPYVPEGGLDAWMARHGIGGRQVHRWSAPVWVRRGWALFWRKK